MDIKALVAQAAKLKDHTQTQTTTDFEPPAAGVTVGRFIEYIELGKQPQKAFKGKPKNPAAEVKITFELLAPRNMKEIEVDGTKKKIAERITLTMTESTNEKAKFKKLFNAMTYGRDNITHMAQMLGEAFIIEIVHNVVEKDGNKKTYANIQKDGAWLLRAPFKVDELAGTSEPLTVPAALSDIRVFLWDLPTKETWDSLFIDGDREVKDAEGNITTVSKNYLQTKLRTATNFDNSPLEAFLEGVDDLPDLPDAVDDGGEEEANDFSDLEDPAVVGTKAKAEAKPAATKKPAAKKVVAKKVAPTEDPLAALGLDS